jgi:hypothetical protein
MFADWLSAHSAKHDTSMCNHCIGNFYKEVLCKNTVSIFLCLCAASASHFRPSGQAAASASLRVEVDVEDQPQRIEIQVLGLNPSHAQQTRDEV